MSNGEVNSPITPKSALDTLKEWKELIAFVALTLSSVTTGLIGKDHPRVQALSWTFAVVFVAASAYAIHRINKRKREQERREKLRAERDALGKPQSAFRGLASFEERDELPGKDRRLEARTIATRIASDDFRFGVVCGDSGCGKTSLLRTEVANSLKKMGFQVSYVRSPRQGEQKSSNAATIESFTREYRALLRNFMKPTTTVLILDQFEEWFIEYQHPEGRQEIGRALRKLTERSPKIVCAIRREFLIDFHDISEELPQHLSNANLFHTKNFTLEQAIDVITECSTAEGIALDESFAHTVSQDLSEGGQVRPPELQIVCTQLARRGALSTQKYRQAGGTAAILAHHIQEALEAAKDRALAARLLRAVCDFPAHAKGKPQTVEQLSADISDGGANKNTKSIVEGLVSQFVANRILLRDEKDNTYALMHDYLVDAIQLATADASTKTEEANQLLRYYVKEARGTIPFKKLRFIKAFAERAPREEPVARALIRRSSITPFLRWGAPLALGSILVTIFLFSTNRPDWDRKFLWSHRTEAGKMEIVLVSKAQPNNRISTQTGELLRIWDGKTGEQLGKVDHPFGHATWSASGKYLLLYGIKLNRLVDIVGGKDDEYGSQESNFAFQPAEGWLTWQEGISEKQRSVIYSLDTWTIVRTFDDSIHALVGGFDRCILLRKEPGQLSLELRELSTGNLVAKLDDKFYGDYTSIDVNQTSLQVAEAARKTSGDITVSIWSLIEGKLIGKSDVFHSEGLPPLVRFTSNGTRVMVVRMDQDSPEAVGLFETTPNVAPIPNVSLPLVRFVRRRAAMVPFWQIPGADQTEILEPSKSQPIVVSGLTVGQGDELSLAVNSERAIVSRKEGIVELWDLAKGKLIVSLIQNRKVISAEFSLGDTAVVVREPNDLISLFDSVDGSPIVAQQPRGGAVEIYYDRDCGRYNTWDETGNVIRYTKRRFWGFLSSNLCN